MSSYSVEVALDLDIRSDRIADGVMEYWMSNGSEECSFSAEVSLAFAGRNHGRPVPVAETDTETDTDTATEPASGN